MADREKVINELVEHIESALDVDSDYVDCVRTDLLQTVVGLLKEQEAVVLCKDCEMNNQCSIQFKFADPDDPEEWYCANGKRKEADPDA